MTEVELKAAVYDQLALIEHAQVFIKERQAEVSRLNEELRKVQNGSKAASNNHTNPESPSPASPSA